MTCSDESHIYEAKDDDTPAFVGIDTFLQGPFVKTPRQLREYNADVAIIGAPFDLGVVHKPGARFGPRAIRQAGYFGAPNDDIYHIGLGIYPTDELKVVDYGDANCPPNSIELSHRAIEEKVRQILDTDTIPVVIGGDHSITLPSATAVANHFGFGNVGMVHFDAHADTAPSSYGGVLESHSTPMRRLIESGAIPGKNFIQVGLRGYWPPHTLFDWMREQKMRWHPMSEIETDGFDSVLDKAINEALDGPDKIYLSVDIDVLDPAFAPGTGTPEPGGLSSSQLLRAIRTISKSVEIVAVDIVEVAPHYEGPASITAEAAHRIMLEAISGIAVYRKNNRT